MTKETKESKREQIAEARESFLGTMGLEDIHYGDTFIFEDIAYRGIRPIRLLADAIDNLQSNGTQDGIDIFLNEIQKKCDELMDACLRWNDEERKAKDKVVPRPIRQELLRLEGYLKDVPGELQAAKESFEALKPLIAGLQKGKAPATEPSHKDSGEEKGGKL